MTYKPTHCKPWKLPPYYMGAHWDGYHVFLEQHRDSDSVTRSNFAVGLAALEALPPFGVDRDEESRVIVYESHAAVGWIEWIAIHDDDTAALVAADAMLAMIDNYPCLSDDHLSDLEWNEACVYWEGMPIRERIYTCDKFGVSIFAARRAEVPNDDTGALFDYLRL